MQGYPNWPKTLIVDSYNWLLSLNIIVYSIIFDSLSATLIINPLFSTFYCRLFMVDTLLSTVTTDSLLSTFIVDSLLSTLFLESYCWLYIVDSYYQPFIIDPLSSTLFVDFLLPALIVDSLLSILIRLLLTIIIMLIIILLIIFMLPLAVESSWSTCNCWLLLSTLIVEPLFFD